MTTLNALMVAQLLAQSFGGIMGIFDRLVSAAMGTSKLSENQRISVIDCETTGLSAKTDRILELAIVELNGRGEVLYEWSTRFNPEGPVGATHIHGIKDSDVADAPLFSDLASDLVNSFKGRALVAHNTRFDLAFLREEFRRAGWDMPWIEGFCTLRESQHFLPHLDRRNLASCCEAAGVQLRGAHSALGDATATSELFRFYTNPEIRPALTPHQIDLINQGISAQWPDKPSRQKSSAPTRTSRPAKPERSSSQVFPLLAEVKNVSLSDIVSNEMPEGSLEYIEGLMDVLADGVVTQSEREQIAALGETLGLSSKDRETCSKAVLTALAVQAWRDGYIENAEKQEIAGVAEMLLLPAKAAKETLTRAEELRDLQLSLKTKPLPENWDLGEPLRVGDRVAFTGGTEAVRIKLENSSVKKGIRLSSGVTSKTTMLVSDGDFSGRKLEAAQELGTRIVTFTEFANLLENIQPAIK
jgi:DNA polymerase-3 subunit epsilon